MKTYSFAALLLSSMLALAGCGQNATEKKADQLLLQAQTYFDNGNYEQAVATIDSLRKNFPEAIEARKTALRIYQQAELKRAQASVERADTALQRAESEYQQAKSIADKLRGTGRVTEEQLRAANLARVRRDSLQTVFDVECAKIKYINKKIKESLD